MQGLLAGPLHTCCAPGAAIKTATFSKSNHQSSARGRQSQALGLPRQRGQWFLTPQALGGLQGICFDRTCQDVRMRQMRSTISQRTFLYFSTSDHTYLLQRMRTSMQAHGKAPLCSCGHVALPHSIYRAGIVYVFVTTAV